MGTTSSKTTATDIPPVTGGKIQQGSGRNLESGTSSQGETESPPNISDEEDGATEEEMCPVLLRPDLGLPVQELVKNQLIIRSSQLATHVLVMGSPSMMREPVRCPYENTGCESFRAHTPQLMKEHFEAKHELHNVQLNFVCPCPAVCNIVDGEPRECEVVEYDAQGGVLAHHLITQHKDYHKTMERALWYRSHPGYPEDYADDVTIRDDSEEKPDLDYLKHLNSGKKFPAWTRKKRHPFPSQRIAETVTIQTVVQNKIIAYACNVPACAGKIFFWHTIGRHTAKGHPGVLGSTSQTEWYERCDACGITINWCHGKMRLHIQAMHSELLGEPKHYVQQALEERERLQALIQEICVGCDGQTIADTAAPGNESDGSHGTMAHWRYQYICPVATCKKRFIEREYAKWHIIVDHEKQWDIAGNDQSEVKS